MSSDSRGEGWGVADCVHTTWRVCIQMSLLLCRHAAWMGFLLSFMGWGGVSPSQRPRPGGCPSCLLRMAIRMEKRGSEPGGQDVWGSWDVFRGGLTGERRNVHESFWVYCTFSIILRNSGNDRQTKHLTSVKDIGTVLNYGSSLRVPSKSSMPSAFLSPSFNSSSISSSVMLSPVLRMMTANSSLSM